MIPINSISSRVLADIVRRQPPSAARTSFAWQMAVGPALARVTNVELVDGVLLVRARDTRWLGEIRGLQQQVLVRVQQLLGPSVTALKLDAS